MDEVKRREDENSKRAVGDCISANVSGGNVCAQRSCLEREDTYIRSCCFSGLRLYVCGDEPC